jgi:hypothetical protein
MAFAEIDRRTKGFASPEPADTTCWTRISFFDEKSIRKEKGLVKEKDRQKERGKSRRLLTGK